MGSFGCMQQAKSTLLLLLKSLPVGCRFNIISFGSHYEVLVPEGSEEFNERMVSCALELHQTMSNNMGGTEILSPLKHVYEHIKIPQNYARQLFI
jgi:hypothetical protein